MEKVTQAEALRYLIDNTPAPPEVLEAAEEMYQAKCKKYDRPPSFEQIKNAKLLPELVEYVRECEDGTSARGIVENMNHPAIRHTQKAAYLANLAIKKGVLSKRMDKNTPIYFAV